MSKWRTYSTTGYTHDVAQDQASAGGVHRHQIRWMPGTGWQHRIVQCNGRHRAYGPVTAWPEYLDAEAAYATALQA